MARKNTATGYGSISRFFHWTTFLLITALLLSGYFMGDIPQGDVRLETHNIHKLIGLFVLLLMLLRIAWTFFNKKPNPLSGPIWQHYLAVAVHNLLYLLLILMPLSGWLWSIYGGKPPFIGSVTLALPLSSNLDLKEVFKLIHTTLAIIIIAFISLHVLAALYHYLIKKQDIFRRM